MLGRIVYCNNVSVEPWSRVRPRKGLGDGAGLWPSRPLFVCYITLTVYEVRVLSVYFPVEKFLDDRWYGGGWWLNRQREYSKRLQKNNVRYRYTWRYIYRNHNAIFDQDISIFELINSKTVVHKSLSTLFCVCPPSHPFICPQCWKIYRKPSFIDFCNVFSIIYRPKSDQMWKDFEIKNHPVIGNVDFYIVASKDFFYHRLCRNK